jgi:hypothetical protein
MASQSQIDANRRNAQKSTGPRTQEGKAKSRRNGLQHGLTAKTCMFEDEDPEALLSILEEIREKFNPQDTDEDFLIERMAKARFKYNRIMPIEAAIYNLRLSVDRTPKEITEALGVNGQRAWAYMRDANGGNALSKLARYETSLLREYDRSRQELEKLQKIRAAGPTPPPVADELRSEPDAPLSPIPPTTTKPPQPEVSTPGPITQHPSPITQPPSPSAFTTRRHLRDNNQPGRAELIGFSADGAKQFHRL